MTDRLAANRANSLLSTGPRTEDGKRKSSLNAVKTALTGVTVLLSTDDAAEYQRHIAAYQNEFQPAGLEESELVQSLADISWRLRRIPGLEMAIYARGTVIYADYFEEQDPDVRRGLIELQTHLIYEKQLRNLQLQESRLVRRREKETAELRRLQTERRQREQEAIGFEFSNAGGKAGTGEHSAPFAESDACPRFATDVSPKTAPQHAADADAPDVRTHTSPATYPAPSVHPSPESIGSFA
jgi:hypothetical protein